MLGAVLTNWMRNVLQYHGSARDNDEFVHLGDRRDVQRHELAV